MIKIENNKLIRKFDGETVMVEAFGENSVRIRVTKLNKFTEENWALIEQKEIIPQISLNQKNSESSEIKANTVDNSETDGGVLTNGKIKVEINGLGKLLIKNQNDEVLLAEFQHNVHTSLNIPSRHLKGISGSNFYASMKFDSNDKEKIFGMGQYQNGIYDLKGTTLELAQRNSQASVPFMYSSLGYGFFWNNPAVGKVTFAKNITEWEAMSTNQLDFWITVGDTPAEIHKNYMEVTGKPPVMPEHGLGFWQCKLRYQTQEEVLEVAREYKKRGIPLDVIVIDFFHWFYEGDWCFDPQYWPDPKAMVDELLEMGIKPMVSVWPTVSLKSKAYDEMREKGYLIRTERGVGISSYIVDPTITTDMTNPEAADYMWEKMKQNYISYGIHDFWLDVAEPEYINYDFDGYRYYKGSAAQVGNEYPVHYTKAFYDGLKKEGKDSVNLVRCAWSGSQKYGALVWSGDIPSTWDSFKIQIVCGLQMAMAGIPWWTTDIGGFHDGYKDDKGFQELLIRWFQYGAFCPVMRLHGVRLPYKEPLSDVGGGRWASGADNEIWSYGEENYEIMKHYIEVRNKLRDYTRDMMNKSHKDGTPIIRPLYYSFPSDENLWEIDDQFMFGDDILVSPIIKAGQRSRKVYLPKGQKWTEVSTNKEYEGGQYVECEAPIEVIPLFIKSENKDLREKLL